MKFYFLELWPIYFLIGMLVLIFLIYKERNKWNFISKTWFIKKSIYSKVASCLYYISIIMMIVALMDLRTKEGFDGAVGTEGLKAKKQESSDYKLQKVAILLDISPSMLVKDINNRSRLQEAIYLIDQYLINQRTRTNDLKKSIIYEISLFVFTENAIRIVPFTRDYNLLDIKLKALENLKIESASSDVLMSIQEVIQYFKNQFINNKLQDIESGGEILVFSDGEQTARVSKYGSNAKLLAPKIKNTSINVLFVGMGTSKGGKIPIYDKKNNFMFYKTKVANGDSVISKMDKNFIYDLGKNINNYKFIIHENNSETLKNIFEIEKDFETKSINNLINSRSNPSKSIYIMIIAIIIWIFAGAFARIKKFELICLLIIGYLFFNSHILYANNTSVNSINSVNSVNSDMLMDLKNAKLNFDQNYMLAMKLKEDGHKKEAIKLFDELMEDNLFLITKDQRIDFLLNYGTLLLEMDRLNEGISLYNYIKNINNINDVEKINTIMRGNVLLAVMKKKSFENKDQQNGNKTEEKKDKILETNSNNKDNTNVFLSKMLNDDRKTQEELIKNIINKNNLNNQNNDW
ncbi:MAG: VWA domain-containing protein [Oligoflexia bacterium]|nr:VWA domain-containing protein [Oligoflexia bacterium]